jgi:cytochrome c oxidase assembly protein subunit 11
VKLHRLSSNDRLAAVLGTVVVGMIALAFAAVPLYRVFCQVTGFSGTPLIAEENNSSVIDRTITVRFNADVDRNMPWQFRPVQRSVQMKLGEEELAFFEAHNSGNNPVVGTATFNVTPLKAGQYFNKIECFCFTEQRLEPGQTVQMPVTFFVDPRLNDDPSMDDVVTITLSYTFYRGENSSAARPQVLASSDNRLSSRN